MPGLNFKIYSQNQILIVQLEGHCSQQKNAKIHSHKWQQSCVHLVKKWISPLHNYFQ